MHVRRHVSVLEKPLRPLTTGPLQSQCTRCRHYSSSSAAYPENIAILGGGISGLASAHFIRREFPKSKITIYEGRKDNLGGWIRSKKTKVEGGNVLFEHGPRTLRPDIGAVPTAQLIQDLGLTSEVITTRKDSPAAKKRYIYYPDRLNRLPSSPDDFNIGTILSLWNSGLIDGIFNAFKEPFQTQRPPHRRDESIGSFLSRRLDPRLANNVMSAVMHGIYAGDIYQLSAKALLQTPWYLEGKFGSIFWGLARWNANDERDQWLTPWHPWDLERYNDMLDTCKVSNEVIDKINPSGPQGASTFTFKDGMQTLVKKLEESLREDENVEIVTGTLVDKYTRAENSEKINVIFSDSSLTPRTFDFVVSTIPAPYLTIDVNVMVVNLFYHNPGLVAQRGFGYLIPRSVPFEQNPERALGVIFNHDAVQGQDTVEGTNLTVMLGGHWWDGWVDCPDYEEGAEMALNVVKRHLGIEVQPDLCDVILNKKCIPQYTVGYHDRLASFGANLQREFNGRVRVVGNQFNGVGVNDCVRSAWMLARSMRGQGWKSRSAGPGIDRVQDEREWLLAPPRGWRELQSKKGVAGQ